jgi:aminoglycoside phosphotransferase (APT) family kinase protein
LREQPEFIAEFVESVLAETAPDRGGDLILSHNDVNPSNIVFDGSKLLFLDWDTAALNNHYYDLASISIFARMDTSTCRDLLAAYGEAVEDKLPAGFKHFRRIVAALAGTVSISLALASGYSGDSSVTSFEKATSLGDFYTAMRNGTTSLATGEGKWIFGMALMREGQS